MAEFPDGKGVLLFGGWSDSDTSSEDRILELRAEADSWTTLDITLQERRKYHTVIPIR